MNMRKRLTAKFLALTMLFCAFASGCDVSEAEVTPEGADPGQTSGVAETPGEADPGQTGGVAETPELVFVPMAEDMVPDTSFSGKTPVKEEPVTSRGIEWYQEEGDPAFQIWVQNDAEYEMKVTIEYDGMPHNGEMVFWVPPHEGGGGYVDSAVEETTYELDFQTENGVVQGSCTVRTSAEPFAEA